MKTTAASLVVTVGIASLALAVAVLGAWAFARAGQASGEGPPRRARRFGTALGVLALWMLATASVARSGLLLDFATRPPPMLLMMLASVAAGLAVGLSPIGGRLARGLPLAMLVGLQGFRLPLELFMHQAAREGVMPVQMSFTGLNFDIVTGSSAVVVALLLATGHAPRALVVGWNVLGALLLSAIGAIAAVSMPAIHAFGTAPERLNTWVGQFPFVWLPTVLVAFALAGHLVIARRLLADGRSARARQVPRVAGGPALI